MLAAGAAILLAPIILGRLADELGLRLAHLMVPALVATALVCFLVARAMQRRTNAVGRWP
jgi:hypothetical protein